MVTFTVDDLRTPERLERVLRQFQLELSTPRLLVTPQITLALSSEIIAFLSIASGTYTPVLTAVTNVTASTTHVWQFCRVGSYVVASGFVDVDPTLPGQVDLGISMPVSSVFTNAQQLSGVSASQNIAGQSAVLFADIANGRANLRWTAVDVTNQPMFCIMGYTVV